MKIYQIIFKDYFWRLTATNSSRIVPFSLLMADSEAKRGFAKAPEKPAEWIASKSKSWGFLEASPISAFTLRSCN